MAAMDSMRGGSCRVGCIQLWKKKEMRDTILGGREMAVEI